MAALAIRLRRRPVGSYHCMEITKLADVMFGDNRPFRICWCHKYDQDVTHTLYRHRHWCPSEIAESIDGFYRCLSVEPNLTKLEVAQFLYILSTVNDCQTSFPGHTL